MRVYHRTTPEAAAAIYETGRMISKETPALVFVSSTPDGMCVGYGEAVVILYIPEEWLTLEDEFPDGEKHFTVPAKKITAEHLYRPLT
jgi:hypothetical protein